MLWLKSLDDLGALYPARLAGVRGSAAVTRPIILRPGGMGDMVLLTRAAGLLGLPLGDYLWFGERRNTLWTRYLGLPSLEYDCVSNLLRGIGGRLRSPLVINSEQTFGLSAVFSSRLTARDGVHCGFSSNRRADLFDRRVCYASAVPELASFAQLLCAAGLTPTAAGSQPPLLPPAGPSRTGSGAALVAVAGLQERSKHLPHAAWRALLHRAAAFSSRVVLVGAARDRRFADELMALSPDLRCENLVGLTTFAETVDCIRAAARLVSVDSGLIHVADFCGIPTDAVFPAGNPAKWRPLHPQSTAVMPGDLPALISGAHQW